MVQVLSHGSAVFTVNPWFTFNSESAPELSVLMNGEIITEGRIGKLVQNVMGKNESIPNYLDFILKPNLN